MTEKEINARIKEIQAEKQRLKDQMNVAKKREKTLNSVLKIIENFGSGKPISIDAPSILHLFAGTD